MKECWKDVVGFEGEYQVSDQGGIRHKVRGTGEWEPMHPYVRTCVKRSGCNRTQYRAIWLKDPVTGKRKFCMLHVLVARAFLPNPEGRPFVDHVNTDRGDNRVENIKWVTSSENSNNPITLDRQRTAMTCRILAREYRDPLRKVQEIAVYLQERLHKDDVSVELRNRYRISRQGL